MLEAFEEAADKALRTKARVETRKEFMPLFTLFQAFPDVERVILFGSRARGDHEERSDIDLAVDAPKMDVLTWDQVCLSITDNSETLLPIDLIWLQQAPAPLAKRIQEEGVVVFEREDSSISGESQAGTFET